ncbi:MAG: 3-oxoacid CoA-transferase subunit B [Propionibacteriaceae bacterium]
MMDKDQIKTTIARRVALELRDGDFVNLGIGIPTLVPQYLPKNVNVMLEAEDGIVCVGGPPEEADPFIVDAGGAPASAKLGGAFVSSAMSFALIRGGHVDATVLGALQVDAAGNLANWIIPGKMVPGMGGAMDLVVGAKRVIVAMEHTQKGSHKILETCTLPLTAAGCVDMIITEMGVMTVEDAGLTLIEQNPLFTVAEIQAATGATLIISDQLKAMAQ